MAGRTDGWKNSVTDAVKDNRPRIWCTICAACHLTVGDARRHWRDAHPNAGANPVEQAAWCFEIYANSRHGRPDNSAAQSARARTTQVAANVQTGTPINTTTLIGINTGYAVLASAVPANSNNAYHYLQTNHPTVMQDAPTLAAAAPIQQPGVTQAPPLPVAPAVAPNPQSLNAPIGHPQAVAPLLQLNRPASVQNEYGDPEECSREWYGRFWRRT